MLSAVFLAFEDLLDAAQRRALLLSLVTAIALLVAIWFGVTLLLQLIAVTGFTWIDRIIGVLGSAGTLVFAWLLFPAMSAVAMSFFLDGVAGAVEARHYPGLPPRRRQSLGEVLRVSLRLALLAILVNLIALPFYFWPVINLLVYYGLNGYLVGREYFVLVALRRLDGSAADAMWRRYWPRLILAGAGVAFLLSLPLVNLVAPIWATAFLVHVFESLRANAAAGTTRATRIEPNSRV